MKMLETDSFIIELFENITNWFYSRVKIEKLNANHEPQ